MFNSGFLLLLVAETGTNPIQAIAHTGNNDSEQAKKHYVGDINIRPESFNCDKSRSVKQAHYQEGNETHEAYREQTEPDRLNRPKKLADTDKRRDGVKPKSSILAADTRNSHQ